MKKIFSILIIIFFLGFVLGETIDTFITQSQFDAIDFTNRQFNLKISQSYQTKDKLNILIDFDDFEKNYNGWVLIKRSVPFFIPFEKYYNCRLSNNQEFCLRDSKKFLLEQVKDFKNNKRDYLKNNQTRNFINELTIENLGIVENELNEN